MKTRKELIKLGIDGYKADQIMLLEKKMLEQVVKFAYRKKDGTTRYAEGTLDRSKMDLGDGTLWEPVGNGMPEKPEWVRYWDLQSMGWRQFNVFNLVAVEG